ncbi:MAG: hypothetical protein CVU59_02965 [Deltaproteobacteria bacterium HGW-Deltaproteobacteria-17]|nr:MAG: hypothetical protein CVU59_02965 [Deltaproteobacteria bacterium HGW-Deltaproteobacteria-17]
MSFEENRALQTRLSLLDQSIDKLRVVFEQFFLGLERFEPVQLRKSVQMELRALKENPPKNTAMKFLLSRMETKFRTYEQYWNRVLREIEDGVYERQLQRMRRKLREEGLPDGVLDNVRTRGELEAAMARIAELRTQQESPQAASREAQPQGDTNAARSAAPAAFSPAGPHPQSPPPSSSDPALRRAYENFVRARLSTGESLEGITPDRFFATISSQIPKVKQAHGCSEVEIQVVVKDNKATLRFLPR